MSHQLAGYHPGDELFPPTIVWRETEEPEAALLLRRSELHGRFWELQRYPLTLVLTSGEILHTDGRVFIATTKFQETREWREHCQSEEETGRRFLAALANPTPLIVEMTKL